MRDHERWDEMQSQVNAFIRTLFPEGKFMIPMDAVEGLSDNLIVTLKSIARTYRKEDRAHLSFTTTNWQKTPRHAGRIYHPPTQKPVPLVVQRLRVNTEVPPHLRPVYDVVKRMGVLGAQNRQVATDVGVSSRKAAWMLAKLRQLNFVRRVQRSDYHGTRSGPRYQYFAEQPLALQPAVHKVEAA